MWQGQSREFYTLQHTTTRCNTLQRAATRCNTLQHAATYCNTSGDIDIVDNMAHHIRHPSIPETKRFVSAHSHTTTQPHNHTATQTRKSVDRKKES